MDLKNITNKLAEWAGNYDVIDPRRIYPTVLTVLIAGLDWSEDQVSEIAKMVLWIFAVDDVIDNFGGNRNDLEKRVEVYKRIFSYKTDHADGEPLARILLSIRIKKDDNKLRLSYCSEFLNKMLDGMMIESSAKIDRNSLSFSDYLEFAKYSIGSPLYLAYCDCKGGLSGGLSSQKYSGIVQDTGIIMRLANDFQSYEREKLEDNLNAANLLENGRQITKDYLKKMIEYRWEEFVHKYSQFNNNPFVKLAWNTTFYTFNFYFYHDFHQVSVDSMNNFVNELKQKPEYIQ